MIDFSKLAVGVFSKEEVGTIQTSDYGYVAVAALNDEEVFYVYDVSDLERSGLYSHDEFAEWVVVNHKDKIKIETTRLEGEDAETHLLVNSSYVDVW